MSLLPLSAVVVAVEMGLRRSVVLSTLLRPTSVFVRVPQERLPAVAPALRTLPSLVVPVAGTWRLPSLVGWE